MVLSAQHDDSVWATLVFPAAWFSKQKDRFFLSGKMELMFRDRPSLGIERERS